MVLVLLRRKYSGTRVRPSSNNSTPRKPSIQFITTRVILIAAGMLSFWTYTVYPGTRVPVRGYPGYLDKIEGHDAITLCNEWKRVTRFLQAHRRSIAQELLPLSVIWFG
eukprot:3317122-Rhodomonas_salina.1